MLRFIRLGKQEYVESRTRLKSDIKYFKTNEEVFNHKADFFLSQSKATATGEVSLDFECRYATGVVII